MIRVAGVHKTYTLGSVPVPVLRGVDLEVSTGEFVMVLGRSGSGKSTLLNILGCLDCPDSGVYELEGQPVHGLSDYRLSMLRRHVIGFVFQAFHLLGGLSIVDNVALPLEYAKVSRRERRARARELLERVGLGHRFDHLPRQLSGGERQRVAVARALANRPRLLLADEPTGNLDRRAGDALLQLLTELHTDDDLTIVMVTHDRSITALADRSIEMVDGRVQRADAGDSGAAA